MTIPGGVHPLFAFGKYQHEIRRSLRFNSADSAYLSRTPASAGSQTTWTISTWIKRSTLGTTQRVFSTSNSSNTQGFYCEFSSDAISFYDYNNPTINWQKTTTQVFRDTSAWYHFLIVFDSTNGTASNRFKFYVNGSEVTAFSISTNPSPSFASYWNAARVHAIGRTGDANVSYFDGYLADIYFIDGQALDPTSFGEFDATTGVWNPKAYTGGSYGTNGFHLDFADNSSNTATTLGKDTAGSNNWTPNNLQVSNTPYASYATGGTNPKEVFDGNADLNNRNFLSGSQVFEFAYTPGLSYSSKIEIWAYTGNGTDGATGYQVNNSGSYTNFSADGTWGWLTVATGSGTLTNLKYRNNANGTGISFISAIRIDSTTILVDDPSRIDSLVDVPTNGSQIDTAVGGEVRGNYCTWSPIDPVSNSTLANGNLDINVTGDGAQRIGTMGVSSGKWYYEFVQTTNASAQPGVNSRREATTYDTRLMYYVDGQKYNGATGSSYGATWTTNDVIGIALDLDNGTLTFYKNGVSQGTAFTGLSGTYYPWVRVDTSGSVCVANWGQRPWAYTAPSGFRAWCTANLPAPLVTKPSTVMDVLTWSGTGGARSFTGLGFSPDFVWIKSRSSANWHNLFDAVRGNNRILYSNATDAEANEATASLTSFNSDGFSLSGNGSTGVGNVNGNGITYAAWCWDAGTTTDPNNTAGSITSTVRANATAGFSIVTYTGTGANASVGHGLGVAPSLIIIKSRTQATARNWAVYHTSIGATKILELSTTNAAQTVNFWQNTAPTSTVFTLSSQGDVNASTYNYVAYCFAPVVGYSNGFSYTGNGSSDGPMVYLGFRPKLIILKAATSVTYGNWLIRDTSRDTYNVSSLDLYPNTSSSEASNSSFYIDILSNGFKIRGSSTGDFNASSATYIGFAWAETPFNYSRAR